MQYKALEQIPLDLSLRPAYGREDFLIGGANQDAINWLDRWPDWPAPALILQGPAASGKSHMAAVWADQSGAGMITPEDLAKASADVMASKAEQCVLDGIDLWVGDREVETKLFHLYNMFKEAGRTMLLTMRMSPTELDFALPDLASRLRAAPAALIMPPDDAMLSSVLIKLFHDRQLSVHEDIIRYIVPRMERSFDAARTIVTKADQAALAHKRGISVPLMRDVLATLQTA